MKKCVLCGLLFLMIGFAAAAQDAPVSGDVNNDSQINIIDALATAQYYVGLIPAVFYPGAADVSGNGVVDIVDALLIAQYYVGLITEFPALSGVEVARSGLARDTAPQPAGGELDSVVTGNNQFAFDCYRQLRTRSGNLFFSPVSLTFAFAMCYAGAAGNTEAEIASALHFTLQEERLHNAFNALELILTTPPVNPLPQDGDELKLSIANSSWGQKDYTFTAQYLDTLALYYGAGINLVDYKTDPEKCRITINDWVSRKTEQRIKDLLAPGSIDTLTRLVLTNAIYFKANWLDPFKEADTSNALFYLDDGSTVTVPLMHQMTTTSYSAAAGQYQAIKLPYQGKKRNAMIIILPAAGQFQTFENSLTLDTFNNIIKGFTRYDVTLTMPKFSYEWSSSFKMILQSLGMNESFDFQKADFSGINGVRDLYISDVFHKSFVAVDEKGTEASAATAIVMAATSMPPSVTMTINRPFLFFIYNEDTKALLFTGRVLNP